MSLMDRNIELFSSYTASIQSAFIQALIAQYKIRNLAYLREIIGTNFTEELLIKYGMADAINSLIADYERIAAQSLIGTGVAYKSIPPVFIAVMKEMDSQFWFEHVRDVGLDAKRNLILASMGEVSEKELTERLLAATRELSEAQANVLTNTSLRTFSRSVFAKGTEILPEDTGYWYDGPRDNKNRPECRWVLEKQTDKGLTRAEIAASPVDMVSGGGWGCRHRFRVVI